MHPLTRSLISVVAGVLLAASAASCAEASPRIGFNDNAFLAGHSSAAATAQGAAGAGADSLRITVDWRTVEPVRGRFNFGMIDALAQEARARGQRSLLILLFAPEWARAATGCADVNNCKLPPARKRLADWARFAATVARRYPDAVGIEVWNEPNLRAFWDGAIDPAYYTEMLRSAYTAVKDAVPSMPVISGGLSAYSGESGSGPGMGAAAYLDRMYAAGAARYMDGVGLHPYMGGKQLDYGFRALSSVLSVRAAANHRAPLWLTELGATTTGAGALDHATQAHQLARLVSRFRDDHAVAGIYVHTLFEPGWVQSSDPERGFGVMAADGAPKPAYCSLAAELGRQACEVPASDPMQDAMWDAQELLQWAAQAAVQHHATSGSYSGLTSATLAAIDKRLSPVAGTEDRMPGPDADPAQIGVWASADGSSVLLCNASRAQRSYCIWNWSWAERGWLYGHADGSTWAAAGAVTSGANWWW